MTSHFQDHRRNGQDAADPETSGHVGEFGIWRRIESGDLGFERHAADRTASRSDLADLRMHRTGVDRAGRELRQRLLLVEIFCRIGGEFGAAAGGTEMEGLSAKVEPMYRR